MWRIARTSRTAALLLLIVSTFSIAACGDRQSSGGGRLQGSACLQRLKGTKALTTNGRVRFALHELTIDYKPGAPHDTIIAVEPQRLDLRFFECSGARFAPSGAIQTGGVTVLVDGGPENAAATPKDIAPQGRHFWLGLSDTRPGALKMMHDLELGHGSWLGEGTAYGLERYQQIVGVKHGKPTTDTHYRLGIKFFGHDRDGHDVIIDCIDYYLRPYTACELWSEVRVGVLETIVLPTPNLAHWAEYLAVADQYFRTHLDAN